MAKSRSSEAGKNCKQDAELYCIQKAKECLGKGDVNLAKSWFLTASNLFPGSQIVKVRIESPKT